MCARRETQKTYSRMSHFFVAERLNRLFFLLRGFEISSKFTRSDDGTRELIV